MVLQVGRNTFFLVWLYIKNILSGELSSAVLGSGKLLENMSHALISFWCEMITIGDHTETINEKRD